MKTEKKIRRAVLSGTFPHKGWVLGAGWDSNQNSIKFVVPMVRFGCSPQSMGAYDSTFRENYNSWDSIEERKTNNQGFEPKNNNKWSLWSTINWAKGGVLRWLTCVYSSVVHIKQKTRSRVYEVLTTVFYHRKRMNHARKHSENVQKHTKTLRKAFC